MSPLCPGSACQPSCCNWQLLIKNSHDFNWSRWSLLLAPTPQINSLLRSLLPLKLGVFSDGLWYEGNFICNLKQTLHHHTGLCLFAILFSDDSRDWIRPFIVANKKRVSVLSGVSSGVTKTLSYQSSKFWQADIQEESVIQYSYCLFSARIFCISLPHVRTAGL